MPSRNFLEFVEKRGIEMSKQRQDLLNQTMNTKGLAWVEEQYDIFDANIEKIGTMIQQKYDHNQRTFRWAIDQMYKKYGTKATWDIANGCEIKKITTDQEVNDIILGF